MWSTYGQKEKRHHRCSKRRPKEPKRPKGPKIAWKSWNGQITAWSSKTGGAWHMWQEFRESRVKEEHNKQPDSRGNWSEGVEWLQMFWLVTGRLHTLTTGVEKVCSIMGKGAEDAAWQQRIVTYWLVGTVVMPPERAARPRHCTDSSPHCHCWPPEHSPLARPQNQHNAHHREKSLSISQ